jgi:hypothetical protein
MFSHKHDFRYSKKNNHLSVCLSVCVNRFPGGFSRRNFHNVITFQHREQRKLRMGWRNFFSSCAITSVFWFWQEIDFGVTYVLRVQYSCGVVYFFWFRREIIFGVTYILRVQYRCVVASVFWLWRETVLQQHRNRYSEVPAER